MYGSHSIRFLANSFMRAHFHSILKPNWATYMYLCVRVRVFLAIDQTKPTLLSEHCSKMSKIYYMDTYIHRRRDRDCYCPLRASQLIVYLIIAYLPQLCVYGQLLTYFTYISKRTAHRINYENFIATKVNI